MPSSQMAAHVARAMTTPPLTDIGSHRAAVANAVESMSMSDEVVAEPVCANSSGVLGEWVHSGHATADADVLYLHSGGFAAGSPAMCRVLAGQLSRAAGVRFFVPAYRLAPEHPYPAALNDAFAVYLDLLSRTRPERLVVGGASAGGGLALALLLRVRDEGLPLPAAAFLISPWVDLRLSSSSMLDPDSGDPLSSLEYLRTLADAYRGRISADDPRVSPVLADLSGLPPLHIEVGSPERLRDDAVALAARSAACHTSTSLTVVEGALHTFPHAATDSPEAAAAVARIALHLRTHLDQP